MPFVIQHGVSPLLTGAGYFFTGRDAARREAAMQQAQQDAAFAASLGAGVTEAGRGIGTGLTQQARFRFQEEEARRRYQEQLERDQQREQLIRERQVELQQRQIDAKRLQDDQWLQSLPFQPKSEWFTLEKRESAIINDDDMEEYERDFHLARIEGLRQHIRDKYPPPAKQSLVDEADFTLMPHVGGALMKNGKGEIRFQRTQADFSYGERVEAATRIMMASGTPQSQWFVADPSGTSPFSAIMDALEADYNKRQESPEQSTVKSKEQAEREAAAKQEQAALAAQQAARERIRMAQQAPPANAEEAEMRVYNVLHQALEGDRQASDYILRQVPYLSQRQRDEVLRVIDMNIRLRYPTNKDVPSSIRLAILPLLEALQQ